MPQGKLEDEMHRIPERQETSHDPDDMLAEALFIIDEARRRGLTVRLVGGLAVRESCRDASFCRRRYRDIDLVGRHGEVKAVVSLFRGLGFAENPHYRLASSGQMAQFFRPCIHTSGADPEHVDDRIDLYVDTFRLDHDIRLADRLTLEEYTVPASDVLLVKLQRASVNEDDVADCISLLKDLPLSERDLPHAINVRYVGRLCAHDWGLHHDVTRNLGRCRDHLSEFGLDDEGRRRALDAINGLERALRETPKSPRWRWRALFGEALPWHDAVDEREGVRIGHLEGV
jgi:hypothetical protein